MKGEGSEKGWEEVEMKGEGSEKGWEEVEMERGRRGGDERRRDGRGGLGKRVGKRKRYSRRGGMIENAKEGKEMEGTGKKVMHIVVEENC